MCMDCLEIEQFFLMKPQGGGGIGGPSDPLRRGQDGLEFWLQETMLKVATTWSGSPLWKEAQQAVR